MFEAALVLRREQARVAASPEEIGECGGVGGVVLGVGGREQVVQREQAGAVGGGQRGEGGVEVVLGPFEVALAVGGEAGVEPRVGVRGRGVEKGAGVGAEHPGVAGLGVEAEQAAVEAGLLGSTEQRAAEQLVGLGAVAVGAGARAARGAGRVAVGPAGAVFPVQKAERGGGGLLFERRRMAGVHGQDAARERRAAGVRKRRRLPLTGLALEPGEFGFQPLDLLGRLFVFRLRLMPHPLLRHGRSGGEQAAGEKAGETHRRVRAGRRDSRGTERCPTF